MPLLAAPAVAEPEVSPASSPERHCVVTLHPLSNAPSQEPAMLCFSTIADSVAFATDGTVQMVSGQKYPTQAQGDGTARDSAATVLLGIEYGDDNWTGSSLTFRGSSGTGCYNGVSYGFSYLSSTWNDEISSSKAYNYCNGWHYEHTNYLGVIRLCATNCRIFGSMNDETSSIIFRH